MPDKIEHSDSSVIDKQNTKKLLYSSTSALEMPRQYTIDRAQPLQQRDLRSGNRSDTSRFFKSVLFLSLGLMHALDPQL